VPVETGRLRDSIHAETVEESDQRLVMQVAPCYEAANEYGFDPPYARRIEYGFMGTDKLGRQYHQAAQPYVRPAWDTQQQPAAQTIKEGVYNALDDAMASVAARRT